MFLEKEITPQVEKALNRQRVVIAHSLEETLIEEKLDNFGTNPSTAASDLDYILKEWKGIGTTWSVLKRMWVLDLASGSGNSYDMFGCWYPHFSRLCAINKANVVAIDKNPQTGLDKIMFTWVVADLVMVVLEQRLNSLPTVRGKKFDLIYSSSFAGDNFCPELIQQLAVREVKLKEFKKAFLQQAGEVLAEDGVMFLGNHDKKYLPLLYTRRGSNIRLI